MKNKKIKKSGCKITFPAKWWKCTYDLLVPNDVLPVLREMTAKGLIKQ